MAKDARFNWREAAWNLHVPMIASLFEQIATPRRLKPLGIDKILDRTGLVLNRVTREEFFKKFEDEHAIQYFYEPFLKAYDPQLRKNLGVWYTPPEIVKYQVARVDTVLREDLNVEDGLADSNVYILDPCCGTGAYLVEVLRKIHDTLKKKNDDALTAQRLKLAAIRRVFGFEILPAPFVVAHLQLGLTLRVLRAPLSRNSEERVGVYLTNALTGWEPPTVSGKSRLVRLAAFPELAEERDAAAHVKRDIPILVILGNPPYNAFAGTSPEEEQGLVDSYKKGLADWGITKNYLDDLYVRFFRIGERRIVKGGRGIVCYISNFSYLGDPSFVVMRQCFLKEFDKLWFDCMNGDSRETGKLTPEGKPDPSVFSTKHNKEGIRVGTAIGLMVRDEVRGGKSKVHFRHFWGVNKRKELLESLNTGSVHDSYEIVRPCKNNRFSFRPSRVTRKYYSWPSVSLLSRNKPMLGLNENRQGALQDYESELLHERMSVYYNATVPWEELVSLHPGLVTRKAGFDPKTVREKVVSVETYDSNRIVPYLVRPFDRRWAFISDVNPLWNRSRPDLRAHLQYSNTFLLTRPAGVASPEGVPFLITDVLGEQDLMRGHAYYFPILTRERTRVKKRNDMNTDMLPDYQSEPAAVANLSDSACDYLTSVGIRNPDKDIQKASMIWMHVLAIGYSAAYLTENADGLRQDWPRVPMPATKGAFMASVELGYRVAALLDTEKPVNGVTCGAIRPEFRDIAVISRVGGGTLDPGTDDLDLTAGWGHAGKDGVCMPGKGRYLYKSTKTKNRKQIKYLGEKTLDVYLNDVAYWSNVPKSVWEFYIGGYQVIKKWLSYREKTLLGRGLTIEDAEYVTGMARRITALILLQPNLDENYEAIKNNTWPWPS